MPSSNPRYANWKAREETRRAIRLRVQSGEPCAICGQPIDLSLPQSYVDPRDGKKKKAPWSFEVDEIIPISRGGLPYGDNCQPAHRACNQRKGAKVANTNITSARPETSREW